MKTLYIECNMGVAGDMLMGALLDTLEDKESFVRQMNHLGIPGIELSYRKDEKCGITGTHVTVKVFGMEEESQDAHEKVQQHEHQHSHEEPHRHEHSHSHETHIHHHGHAHSHTSVKDIYQIVDKMDLSEKIKEDIKTVYDIIAVAENKVHGKSIEQVHFHEVGTMDALADITGCCILMNQINPDKIIVSPVKTGYGHIHCAHGILPVPAPATALILQGVPTSAGNIQGELCTPTGAALIKHFADTFSYQPEMTAESIGYGTGNKDFDIANCVRVLIGTTDEDESFAYQDKIIELTCNIDDMTGEELGYAKEKLIEGKAVDVYTISIGMKKNRPGTMLSVLCKLEDREEVVRDIFQYTTTIGIRMYECPRYILHRREEIRHTDLGEVRVKISEGYNVKREKIEYEDIKNILEKK